MGRDMTVRLSTDIAAYIQPLGRRYGSGERQTVMDALRTEYRFALLPQEFLLTGSDVR